VKSKDTDDVAKNNEDTLELILTEERDNKNVIKLEKDKKDMKNILVETFKKHQIQTCVKELECNLNLAQKHIHQLKVKERASLKEVMKNKENKTKELLLHFEVYKNDLCAADKRLKSMMTDNEIDIMTKSTLQKVFANHIKKFLIMDK